MPLFRKRLKESQFDDAAFEYCLAENFGNNKSNVVLVLRGYGLLKKRNILRLKLANARLRGSGKKVIDDLEREVQRASKAFDEFLNNNLWE